MKNIEHLCRICVRESHFFKHIYSQSVPNDCIFKIINSLCDVNISESDGLPEYICGECFGKLLELQHFKKMCHDGMTALLSLKTKYTIKRGKQEVPVGGDNNGGTSQKPCSSQLLKDKLLDGHPSTLGEKSSRKYSSKEIAVNEIYIKSEPDDETEEILSSDADDEVITPEVQDAKEPVSILHPGVVGQPVLKGQHSLVSPPVQLQTVQNLSKRRQHQNQIDNSGIFKRCTQSAQSNRNLVEGALPSAAVKATQRVQRIAADCLTNNSITTVNDEKVGSSHIQVRMAAGVGVQAPNTREPSVKLKQKAVLITDPNGQGNVILQKMGPNKFLPLMVTKQPLILLHSPGNPGILQAAYVSQGGAPMHHRHHPAPPMSNATAPSTRQVAEVGRGEEYDDRISAPSIVHEDMGVSYLCTTVPSDHRPYMCETCGKCFRRGLHLRYHRSTHRDERPFACTVCGKSFKLKTILTTHMMTHSQEPPRFACDQCEKKFPTRARLKYHQVVHSSERNFECHECGKRFKTKHQLSVHYRTHLSRESPFTCPICEQKFKQLTGLKKHRARLGH